MGFSFYPDYMLNSIQDITPEYLEKENIDFLILDLDNTISPYGINTPTDETLHWIKIMKNAGIRLYIISNNRGKRPEIFSQKLDIPYIKKAGKPSTKKIFEAIRTINADPEKTAMVGDQIYTDAICANRAGVRCILVHPIKFTNVFLEIRYFFELPFRHVRNNASY